MASKILSLQNLKTAQDVTLLKAGLSVGNCKKLSSLSFVIC
jgi:hypothetical protein